MGIIAAYSSQSIYTGPPLDLSKAKATERFLEHYDNLLTLKFFHTHGTRLEKQQAADEMTVCERKLAFWRRHPNYVEADALRGVQELKRKWSGR